MNNMKFQDQSIQFTHTIESGTYYICDPVLFFSKTKIKELGLVTFDVIKTKKRGLYFDQYEHYYAAKSGLLSPVPFDLVKDRFYKQVAPGGYRIHSDTPIVCTMDDEDIIKIGNIEIDTYDVYFHNAHEQEMILQFAESLRD